MLKDERQAMIEYDLMIADEMSVERMRLFLASEFNARFSPAPYDTSLLFYTEGIRQGLLEPGKFNAERFCQQRLKKPCAIRLSCGLYSGKVTDSELLGYVEVLSIADRFMAQFPNDLLLNRGIDSLTIMRKAGHLFLDAQDSWSEKRLSCFSVPYTLIEF